MKTSQKKKRDTLIGNMDTQIFLGGPGPTTIKNKSGKKGERTLMRSTPRTPRGNSPSYGTNYSKLGHELLSRDELAVLDGGKVHLAAARCAPISFGQV